MAYTTFYNVNDAAERISTLASLHKAFLFAANFECTEFIIVENPMQQTEVLFYLPSGTNVNKDMFRTRYERFTFQAEPFERY